MRKGKNTEKILNRLRIILEESGMSQKEFGERVLGIEDNPAYTNDIFKGRKSLSRSKAFNIVNYFPSIRIEWVLGEDDYKTEAEKIISIFQKDVSEVHMREVAFIVLAQLSGYNIFLSESPDAENIIESIKRGYAIQHGTEIVGYIPIEKFNLLALDMQELAEQRIKSFLRECEV